MSPICEIPCTNFSQACFITSPPCQPNNLLQPVPWPTREGATVSLMCVVWILEKEFSCFSAWFLLLSLRPSLCTAESGDRTLPGPSTCTGLGEEQLLHASHPRIPRLIVSQVCLWEQDPSLQLTWGSNKSSPVCTLLGPLHPSVRFDPPCRTEAFAKLPALHCLPRRWQAPRASRDGRCGTEFLCVLAGASLIPKKCPQQQSFNLQGDYLFYFFRNAFCKSLRWWQFYVFGWQIYVALLVSRKSNWVVWILDSWPLSRMSFLKKCEVTCSSPWGVLCWMKMSSAET